MSTRISTGREKSVLGVDDWFDGLDDSAGGVVLGVIGSVKAAMAEVARNEPRK